MTGFNIVFRQGTPLGEPRTLQQLPEPCPACGESSLVLQEVASEDSLLATGFGLSIYGACLSKGCTYKSQAATRSVEESVARTWLQATSSAEPSP